MNELWKPVLGWEHFYSVSDQGRIARITTYGNKPMFRILGTHHVDGYEYCCFSQGQRKKMCRVHRVVWEAFNGAIPDKIEVNHINSQRCDNRLVNLNLMTRSENCRYAYSNNGRKPTYSAARGSKHATAKLTEADIPVIRALAASGMQKIEIGLRYGLSGSNVCSIVNGKTWRHVPISAATS